MDPVKLEPGEITSRAFPPPPPVHWTVLLAGSCLFDGLAAKFAPNPYSSWIGGLLLDAWATYFCIWLRRLDRESVSYRWCIAITAAAVLGQVIADSTADTSWWRFASLGLLALSIGVYVLLVLSIRTTLLRHYNEREPVGLTLGPWVSILLSFYYFQYKLYPVARFKDRIEGGATANPGLLS